MQLHGRICCYSMAAGGGCAAAMKRQWRCVTARGLWRHVIAVCWLGQQVPRQQAQQLLGTIACCRRRDDARRPRRGALRRTLAPQVTGVHDVQQFSAAWGCVAADSWCSVGASTCRDLNTGQLQAAPGGSKQA